MVDEILHQGIISSPRIHSSKITKGHNLTDPCVCFRLHIGFRANLLEKSSPLIGGAICRYPTKLLTTLLMFYEESNFEDASRPRSLKILTSRI